MRPLASLLRPAIAALAGCTQPVIEMSLRLPDSAATAAFDMTCVGAVKVDVVGNDPGDGRAAQVIDKCLDTTSGLRGFADVGVMLRGQFTFDVPGSGLAGVQLRGFSGRCSDPPDLTYESVFYGGAAAGAATKLVVPVNAGVSCNMAQSYKVRVLDLTALYGSTTAACATPGDSVNLFAGVIRPRMLGAKQPSTIFEYGVSSAKTADGTGTLQSYRPSSDGPSCVALGYRGTNSIGYTCVNSPAQARGLCAGPEETELVALPLTVAGSIDIAMAETYGAGVVVGAVWETWSTGRRPLAGATVMLEKPENGKVVYVDLSIEPGASPPRLRSLTPINEATSTTSGGGFVVYFTGEPTNLIVSAPNHVAQTLRIGGAPDVLSSLLVPLALQ